MDRLTGTIHELSIPNPHPDDVYVKMLEQDKDELAEAMKRKWGIGGIGVGELSYVRIALLEEAGYDLTEYRK